MDTNESQSVQDGSNFVPTLNDLIQIFAKIIDKLFLTKVINFEF